MQRALELARLGRGFVEPNPMVGAVLVREEQLVGEGFHERFGAAHAEVNAIRQAGESARGATLYVTLEPCCHQGKTPPCTEAVIYAGIRRVVAAMRDPFPKVASGGVAALREAGIAVEVGEMDAEARDLNAPYLTLLERGRPFVHAKWAQTLDGKIASRTGHSQWISGEESRRFVHEWRGKMDAILVGAGTVRADDPQLTARPPGPRTPLRIVLTRSGELADCQLLRTAQEIPVLVAGPRFTYDQRARYESFGCDLFELTDIGSLLAELGRRRMTNLLVEGGSEILGAFGDGDWIDEVHIFIAPKLLGGRDALPPFGGAGSERVDWAHAFEFRDIKQFGRDVYINARRAAAQTS